MLRLFGLPTAILMLAIATQMQNVPGAQRKVESSDKTAAVVKSSVEAVVLIVTSDANGLETRQGSGFIVSTDGRIITNYHVIKDAKNVLVKLSNGAFFPMESVLATDPVRDLAIIKVAGKNLPTLTLGDSGKAAVGERVVAIGSPLGLQNTVSDGIISALRDEKADVGWIQTTAPVSPGNSGDPLILMDGSVVGVITWGVKIGQNLNFAAPWGVETRTISLTRYGVCEWKPTSLQKIDLPINAIRTSPEVSGGKKSLCMDTFASKRGLLSAASPPPPVCR